MKKVFISAALAIMACEAVSAQTLQGTGLLLNGPQNTNMVGGVGTQGDTSCPHLSTLLAGQFAYCYLSADKALELGYPNGTYSPFARMTDIQSVQTAQTNETSQIATLGQQITALQAQVAALSTQVGSQIASATTTTVLDVVLEGGNLSNYGFLTLPLVTVNADTASGFNRSTSAYTIPSAGYYLVVSKMRFSDNVPGGISFGQGTGTSAIDDPNVLWSSTQSDTHSAYSRNSSLNTTIAHYNEGDQVKMYVYLDYQTLLPVTSGEMTIVKLGN